jgi:hypothetical protein
MLSTSCTIYDFSEPTLLRLKAYFETGGRHLVLEPSAPKGALPFELPADCHVVDLRYGGINIVQGRHPRLEGLWTQYSNLDTGLARNITFSQTITDETPIENWKSEPYSIQRAPIGAMVSEEYRHQHNHYQNLHSEVFNFAADLNGVSIWGDSAALAPGAKSWGAFFSARSWPVKWAGYTPVSSFSYKDEDFDAALVGVEIDVLNAGKDWNLKSPLLPMQLAKIGMQIVGFGNKNTAAIEIRSEDSDDSNRGPDTRRGAWHWGIMVRGSLDTESTVLMAENGRIKRGIDFDLSTFTEGAMRITGQGPSSGIVFDDGASGEVYSDGTSGAKTLNIRVGKDGLRVWDSTGQHVLMEITDEGVRIVKVAE